MAATTMTKTATVMLMRFILVAVVTVSVTVVVVMTVMIWDLHSESALASVRPDKTSNRDRPRCLPRCPFH